MQVLCERVGLCHQSVPTHRQAIYDTRAPVLQILQPWSSVCLQQCPAHMVSELHVLRCCCGEASAVPMEVAGDSSGAARQCRCWWCSELGLCQASSQYWLLCSADPCPMPRQQCWQGSGRVIFGNSAASGLGSVQRQEHAQHKGWWRAVTQRPGQRWTAAFWGEWGCWAFVVVGWASHRLQAHAREPD